MVNSNSGCINEAPVDDPEYLCVHHKRCRPNGSERGMYEHVSGILKHTVSLIVELKKKCSPLLKSTKINNTILNSKIRY